MIDEKRIASIKARAERFDFGKSVNIAADYRFLLEQIDELLKARQRAQFLIKQIGESTDEETAADYRRCTFTSRRVCTRTAFNAAKEATQ